MTNDVTKFHADPHYKPKMTVDDKLDALMQKLIEIDIHVAELRSTLVSTFKDEFSLERKAASDRLGATLLTRMKGEFMAREMTAPSGGYWCDICNTAYPADIQCKHGRPG